MAPGRPTKSCLSTTTKWSKIQEPQQYLETYLRVCGKDHVTNNQVAGPISSNKGILALSVAAKRTEANRSLFEVQFVTLREVTDKSGNLAQSWLQHNPRPGRGLVLIFICEQLMDVPPNIILFGVTNRETDVPEFLSLGIRSAAGSLEETVTDYLEENLLLE
ncbi:hypothetical protein BDR07DRAFT_1381250 [Suillus spraguei]|nr:hypothetical protein BDR07DRAFT_1381250 [Suillus spraguei]